MDTFHPFKTLFQKHSFQTLCVLNQNSSFSKNRSSSYTVRSPKQFFNQNSSFSKNRSSSYTVRSPKQFFFIFVSLPIVQFVLYTISFIISVCSPKLFPHIFRSFAYFLTLPNSSFIACFFSLRLTISFVLLISLL